MKQNVCDDFPGTVIIGSSALYPPAKGAVQMLIIIIIIIIYITAYLMLVKTETLAQLLVCGKIRT